MKYMNEMLNWVATTDKRLNKYVLREIEKQKRIHSKYIYRPDRVEQYIAFTENEFYLTRGDLRKITLLPPQKWWIELLLGYDMIDEKGRQVMLINEFFLNMGRGSGKSSFVATMPLYWLICGGVYNGEAQIIAYDNKQARQVYDQVAVQAQASPFIEKLNQSKLFKSTKVGLKYVPTQSQFFKQTNDEKRAQGGDTSLNIFDEVHTYKDDVAEAVNKGSRQKQANWQSIYITSGGMTRNGLYDKMIERFTSEQEFENDRSFGLLYKLESVEQVKDKKNWSMALPLLGDLPIMSNVEKEYEISQGDPALQTKFLAYNMGIQMNDVTHYFTNAEAQAKVFDETLFDNAPVYVGIDLALVGDLTAIAFITERDGIIYTKTYAFVVKRQFEGLDNDTRDLYEQMVDEGSMIILDTDYVNVHDLIPTMRDFKEKHNCQYMKVAYDPARYEILKDLIETFFFDIDDERQKAIRQGFAMSDYIKLFKENIKDNKMIHNQKLLEWSLMNVAVKIGVSGDYMYTKLLDREKIDPVVALTMALEGYILDEQKR